MTNLADLCTELPMANIAEGETLLRHGDRSGRIYVLLDGTLEVVKGDFQINVISDRGAIFGEMSALLDAPHTATVRALTPCTVRVSHDGDAFLRSNPSIAYLAAQTLAQRLDGVSNYLVDLKRQFEGEKSHLGVVDAILESLVHEQRTHFEPGSDRDPGY